MKKRILVIEDDQGIRESFREILEDAGYQVHTATNGLDGLNFLKTITDLPHLLLLDVLMPVMDGPSFRTLQLSDFRLKDIPTIILSANSTFPEFSAMKATRQIRKPVDLDELLDTVANTLLHP